MESWDAVEPPGQGVWDSTAYQSRSQMLACSRPQDPGTCHQPTDLATASLVPHASPPSSSRVGFRLPPGSGSLTHDLEHCVQHLEGAGSCVARLPTLAYEGRDRPSRWTPKGSVSLEHPCRLCFGRTGFILPKPMVLLDSPQGTIPHPSSCRSPRTREVVWSSGQWEHRKYGGPEKAHLACHEVTAVCSRTTVSALQITNHHPTNSLGVVVHA